MDLKLIFLLLALSLFVANWTNASLEDPDEDPPFPSHIRVTAIEPPLVEGTGFRINYWSILEREILNWLEGPLHFKYTVTPPPDIAHGGLWPNGSWNGIIGHLSRKGADMGAASFTLTLPRYQVVDYTVPHSIDGTILLIPFPKEDSKAFAAVIPYSLEVWILWIFTLLAVSFALWMEPRIRNSIFNTKESLVDMSGQFLFIFGILIGQESGAGPARRFSFRLILGVWALCAVVFYNAYGGVLFSVLTVPSYTVVARNLKDVASPSSPVLFTTVRSTSVDGAILSATNGTFKTIAESFRKHPETLVSNDRIGVDMVATGKYVYGATSKQIRNIIQEDYKKIGQCRFTIADESFFERKIGFTLQKKSPLKKMLDKKILLMQQGGFLQYWDHQIFTMSHLCKVQNGKIGGGDGKPKPLRMDQMLSPFIVLGIGAVVASALLIFERLAFVRRDHHRNVPFAARQQ